MDMNTKEEDPVNTGITAPDPNIVIDGELNFELQEGYTVSIGKDGKKSKLHRRDLCVRKFRQ